VGVFIYVSIQVDTGCDEDAVLEPRLFQKIVQELHGKAGQVSAETETGTGAAEHRIILPEVVFHGETWTNLTLSSWADANLLGLRFLARHLTTLNFPNGAMYLQRVNDEAIAKDNDLTNEPIYAFEMEADKFLANLIKQGQLPGSQTNEHGEITISQSDEKAPETYPIALTCIITKKGDVCTYHYLVVRASKASAWKLQRAWRTDAKEHLVEEYHVP
jgi:predicted aspartyl protease